MIIMMGLDPASQIIRADPMRTNRNLTRANNYGDVFLVKPISDELFRLAIEDWNIFLRWEAAFQQGNTTQDSHPALLEERPRHLQLKLLIGNQLAVVPEKSKPVNAVFRHQSAGGRDTEVT
jgi:hypothetical protein